MQTLSVIFGILALVAAVFWAVVGTGGLTGRLTRNRWVGVRSDETMRSAEAFALGNKAAGPGFLCAALILAICGVLSFGSDLGFLFGVAGLVVGFLVAVVAASFGVRVAATVPDPEDAGGCSSGCCSGGDAAEEPAADDPAADCGAASCGSCALQGMCTSDPVH